MGTDTGNRLALFLQQMKYLGYAVDTHGDIGAIIAEQQHQQGHVPCRDSRDRPLWDDPSLLDNMVVVDVRRKALPYWWALPAVVEGAHRGEIGDRRSYVRGA